MKLIILHFQIYHYINIQYGSKNEILKVLREKKGLNFIYRRGQKTSFPIKSGR